MHLRELKIVIDTVTNMISSDFSRRYYVNGIFSKINEKRCYIFRYDTKWGVLGVLKSYVFHYIWAKKNGYIPVVDYESPSDCDNGILARNNVWDAIFVQEISAKEAISRKGTIVGARDIYDDIDQEVCNRFNSNGLPFIEYNESNWRNYYREIHEIIGPIFKLHQSIIDNVEDFVNREFQGDILGVIMREEFSEEANAIYDGKAKALYSRHPLLPSTNDIIDIVEKYMDENRCQKVFVSSMFSETINLFRERLGDRVICINRKRKDFSFIYKVNDITNNITKDDLREVTPELIDISSKYIEETIVISKCNYLITGANSEAIISMSLNGGTYKDVFFLNDKRKIAY